MTLVLLAFVFSAYQSLQLLCVLLAEDAFEANELSLGVIKQNRIFFHVAFVLSLSVPFLGNALINLFNVLLIQKVNHCSFVVS